MRSPGYAALLLTAWSGFAAAANGTDVSVQGHIFQPESLPPPDIGSLKVPRGFTIAKVTEGLGNARILAVSEAGNVYVTRRDLGDVMMLKLDAGGRMQGMPVRVASRAGLHGIAFDKNRVFLVTAKEIFVGDVRPDGMFGPLDMIVHDLPDAGQHNSRTVQVGPDGKLYVSVGSTCNECIESNPENATLLRVEPDGTSRSIFASGLRNTIGFDWNPNTGELWGMDHGIDWLGDEVQPEELNRIERGKRYGWPFFYGANAPNPHQQPPGDLPKGDWERTSTPMVLGYIAHAAPMQMAFYTSTQFPQEYRGDAFVAMRGSWNRKPASGYEVVRVHFEKGQPKAIEPFVTGFVAGKSEYGRLCGLAVTNDGALLFTDDRNGVLYRVSYDDGKAASAAAKAPPGEVLQAQLARGADVPLALQRVDAKGAALDITSASFAADSPIPRVHSDYDQGASPRLAWSAGPQGTKSYALIVEDPDVGKPPKPVVHWIAWNIPANVTALREGLQAQDRLNDPPGMRQGPTTPGRVGYYGPRPPAGDPPHHYHFQLFALDRELDLPAGADRDMLVEAIRGHVLASGDLVGTFQRPADPVKP